MVDFYLVFFTLVKKGIYNGTNKNRKLIYHLPKCPSLLFLRGCMIVRSSPHLTIILVIRYIVVVHQKLLRHS